MPTVESIIAVALAGLALSATPGPSMLYVLSRSVGQSRAAGLASAIGLGLGGVALAAATALGLAAILKQSEWAIDVLRIAGSAYLVYLGVQMIWEAQTAPRQEFKVEDVRRHSLASIIWQGVLVEVLNPKTVLFFVLFLPQFVEASGGSIAESNVTLQLLILGILVPLTAVPSDLIVAFVGGSVAEAVNNNPFINKALSWVGGLILIAIALNLHFSFI
ncbi:MAG: LysE family translocator [Pseudomonadota bacterium]